MPMHARHAAALAWGLTLAIPVMAASQASAPCGDAIIHAVLAHVGAPDDGQVRASACRTLGGRKPLVAVAIAYEPAGYDWRNSADLPVHVAWFDPRGAKVVASTRADIGEDAATQVDEASLRWESLPGIGRDAAALVVTDFVLQSFMDGDSGPTWTLFVADGPRLQAVMGPILLSHTQCSRACRDAGPGERHTRTMSLAPADGMHHGLRDFVATLHDSTQRAPIQQLLRFDGRRYEPKVDDLVAR